MYTGRRFAMPRMVLFTSILALRAAPMALALCLIWEFTAVRWFQIPVLVVTVMGTAVSFYLGFKGNSAYDRLWEARKIWGGVVNTSRTWGIHVVGFVEGKRDASAVLRRELIYRHVAWLAALRIQLRQPRQWEHHGPIDNQVRQRLGTLDQSDARLKQLLEPFLDVDELAALMGTKNRASQLLRTQAERLRDLRNEDCFDDFRHMEMAHLLEEMFTLQGKAERIKNFPLPRQYATGVHVFVQFFVQVLPWALVPLCAKLGPNLVWVSIPASMAMSWVFSLWDLLVEYSENPFEGLINDIPMTALSRTIEIDLREMLGETELPPSLGPTENVLM